MMLQGVTSEELDKCLCCQGEWSLHTAMERYCVSCKTHIMIIEDEIYHSQGW